MRRIFAELAAAAVRAVAASDVRVWRRRVGMGADGTPTSQLDKVAEDAILAELRALGDPYNVLSEEHEYIDNGRDETLLMDPVDGTYNALHGIPNYSVVLAVGRGGLRGIRCGLIREFTTGNVFYAEKSKGAWLNNKRIRVSPWTPRQDLFNLYLGRAAHPLALALARRPRRVRNLGVASLDMAMVATGAADLYLMASENPRIRLRISDIAASALLVREAGGEVYDLEGNVLDMPFDAKARSNVLTVGDRKLLQEVLP